MKTLIISFLFFLLVCGCSKSTLYISGDVQAVGAEIYVDGKKVGVMEKKTYVGSTSKDPLILGRENKMQQLLGIKSGDIFSGAEIKIASGKHEIMFTNEGKSLKKDINIQGENFISINFSKMVIQGGE
jgi:hypothetical protein